jgi:hypothetical protein
MARSKAGTVAQYLRELPPDRRAVVSAVRDVILENLPAGYQESMNWGMISYEIPLERYPKTYNGQPLSYAALAAQKNYFVLYLMGVYSKGKQAGWLAKEFEKRGKTLDMGKSCVRFKTIDDLPMDVIGDVIASTPPKTLIELFETSRPKKASR